MHSRQPVQVEQVTDEDLMNAEVWDLDKELQQLAAQLRTKLLFLRKNNHISECTFRKLLRVQGIVPAVSHSQHKCKFEQRVC